MNLNILKEVAQGILSDEEADNLLDGILDSDQAAHAETLLCLSRAEWTAHCQGALWSEIANWRLGGWPAKCSKCDGEIHVEKFGWRVIELDGTSILKHIRCPVE